jgi:hypothetical protein
MFPDVATPLDFGTKDLTLSFLALIINLPSLGKITTLS